MSTLFRRALALAAVIAAVVVAAPSGVPGTPAVAGAAVGNCTPGADWGTLRQDLATQVVQLVNQHRASLGLSQLTVTTPLTNAAIWKSRHMAYYRYMQHADPAPPVARSVSDRLQACGYPTTTAGWGENIAYGYSTANAVMQAWLELHRPSREHPERELPRDRRRRSRVEHGHALLDAGVRHVDDGRHDAAASADLRLLERQGRRRRRQGRLPSRPRLQQHHRQRRVQRAARTRPHLRLLQRQGRRRRRQGRLPSRPRLQQHHRQRRVQRAARTRPHLRLLQREGRRRRRQGRLPSRPRLQQPHGQLRVQLVLRTIRIPELTV